MSGVRLYAFKLCNEAIISPWTMGGQRGRPWDLSLSKTRQHKWISVSWMSHTTHKQVYISMTTSDDLSVVITTLLHKCSVHMGMTTPIFTCTFSGLHLTQLWYYCGDRISQTDRETWWKQYQKLGNTDLQLKTNVGQRRKVRSQWPLSYILPLKVQHPHSYHTHL